MLSQFKVPSGDGSEENAEALSHFYEVILQSLDVIKSWAEKIPGFSDLCKEDQELLLQSACLELFILRVASRYAIFTLKSPIVIIMLEVVSFGLWVAAHTQEYLCAFAEFYPMMSE